MPGLSTFEPQSKRIPGIVSDIINRFTGRPSEETLDGFLPYKLFRLLFQLGNALVNCIQSGFSGFSFGLEHLQLT